MALDFSAVLLYDPFMKMTSPMLTAGDRMMIRHIVDGYHVSLSDLRVAKLWLKRCRTSPRELSHEAARVAIAVHQENRKFYRYVMRGT